jgi:hypothetical protein
MSEIITMPKFYSNRDISQLLGCSPEYVRKLKSTRKDELEGLWNNDNPDGETYWTQEGLDKIASMMQTPQAKEYCAGALARRTSEAIAVDRAELYQNNEQASTRTGHETAAYTINEGRYSDLEENLGDAIADQKIANGAVKRIDAAVVKRLLNALNMGDDIDIGALLGN